MPRPHCALAARQGSGSGWIPLPATVMTLSTASILPVRTVALKGLYLKKRWPFPRNGRTVVELRTRSQDRLGYKTAGGFCGGWRTHGGGWSPEHRTLAAVAPARRGQLGLARTVSRFSSTRHDSTR